MRESMGSVFLYNIVIIFFLIVFAFIAGTLSYYKAFKVNTIIMSAVEKYEGYNRHASKEIHELLNTIGYRYDPKPSCPRRNGKDALPIPSGTTHRYCVYEYSESGQYRSYGVTTYMDIDLPLVGGLTRFPIYSKTMRLYNF